MKISGPPPKLTWRSWANPQNPTICVVPPTPQPQNVIPRSATAWKPRAPSVNHINSRRSSTSVETFTSHSSIVHLACLLNTSGWSSVFNHGFSTLLPNLCVWINFPLKAFSLLRKLSSLFLSFFPPTPAPTHCWLQFRKSIDHHVNGMMWMSSCITLSENVHSIKMSLEQTSSLNIYHLPYKVTYLRKDFLRLGIQRNAEPTCPHSPRVLDSMAWSSHTPLLKQFLRPSTDFTLKLLFIL